MVKSPKKDGYLEDLENCIIYSDIYIHIYVHVVYCRVDIYIAKLPYFNQREPFGGSVGSVQIQCPFRLLLLLALVPAVSARG